MTLLTLFAQGLPARVALGGGSVVAEGGGLAVASGHIIVAGGFIELIGGGSAAALEVAGGGGSLTIEGGGAVRSLAPKPAEGGSGSKSHWLTDRHRIAFERALEITERIAARYPDRAASGGGKVRLGGGGACETIVAVEGGGALVLAAGGQCDSQMADEEAAIVYLMAA